MEAIRNISFIGSGNLAWHLAPALENAGYKVSEIYSRTAENGQKLVRRLYNARLKEDLDFSGSDADLLIISVKDEAIESISTELILKENCAVVHTSGTQPLSILGYVPTELTGVLYPLQTFTKSKSIDFREIPFCIEGMTSNLFDQLAIVAGSISSKVYKIDSHDRRVLHLAAVFACNFTNHMFSISKSLLDRQGMEFDLLRPLIVETINKSLELGPEKSQTGPAIREDADVIDQHLSYLANDEKIADIYDMLSRHIITTYK